MRSVRLWRTWVLILQFSKGDFDSGGLFGGDHAFNHAHDVGLLHNQELLAVDLDFRARPLPEQDAFAWFEFDRREFAALVAGAGSDRDDLALLRLLLDGVGNDDAAFRFVVALNAADDDAVVQRTKFHGTRFRSACVNSESENRFSNSAVRL